jgi:hypothetical protein
MKMKYVILFGLFISFNVFAQAPLQGCHASEDNLIITCKDGRIYNLVTPINGLNFQPQVMPQDNTRVNNHLTREGKVRNLAGFQDEPYVPANKTKGQ